jgi:hypothetical protein
VESRKRCDLPFLLGSLRNQGDRAYQGCKVASTGGLFDLAEALPQHIRKVDNVLAAGPGLGRCSDGSIIAFLCSAFGSSPPGLHFTREQPNRCLGFNSGMIRQSSFAGRRRGPPGGPASATALRP